MKICVLTYNLDAESGGGGRYGAELVEGLIQRGHQVVVLQEKPYPGGHTVLGRGFGVIASAIRSYAYIRECDIVHALDVYPFGIIAWLATRVARKPYIITAQGSYAIAPLHNWKTRALARATYRAAQVVIAISGYTAQRVREDVPFVRMVTVPHGINVAKYPPAPIRAGMVRRLISVGGLKSRKGYDVALRAFAVLRRSIPELRYTIVGDQNDASYTRSLHELCRALGIERHVDFCRNISDAELLRLYAQSDIFLLPSVNDGDHFEGFGLVFLEAAIMGLPVIGTTGNGISDAVSDGGNGILVPQHDASAVAAAVERIYSDEQLWRVMSSKSRAWAEQHALSDVISSYIELYQAALRECNRV